MTDDRFDRLGTEWESVSPRTEKPHGRVSWTIHLGGSGGYIDLAVFPRRST